MAASTLAICREHTTVSVLAPLNRHQLRWKWAPSPSLSSFLREEMRQQCIKRPSDTICDML